MTSVSRSGSESGEYKTSGLKKSVQNDSGEPWGLNLGEVKPDTVTSGLFCQFRNLLYSNSHKLKVKSTHQATHAPDYPEEQFISKQNGNPKPRNQTRSKYSPFPVSMTLLHSSFKSVRTKSPLKYFYTILELYIY